MNIKKILVLLVVLACFVLVLSSCDEEDYEYYEVTYYVDDQIYYEYEVVGTYMRQLDWTPSKFGYKFLGLYDSPEGGSQIFNENGRANVDINSACTLYAQWEIMDFKIIFDPNGGYLDENLREATYTYDTTMSSFPIPQMENMSFIGWKSSYGTMVSSGSVPTNDGVKFNSNHYGFNGDTCTLTAIWDVKKYNITFEFNDPTMQNQTISLKYDESFTSSMYPEKIDTGSRELMGWTASYGSSIPWDENLTGDVTLFAMWKDYKTITVYELVGGEPQEKRVYSGDPFYTPERGGYEFMGWYSSETMAGLPIGTVSYTNAPPVIYASWTMETYTVKFMTDLAVLETLYYTIEDTRALPAVSKANYSFVGWCDSEDLSGTPRLVIRPGSYGDLTLYPLFKGDDRTVNLDPAEGMLGLLTQTVEYGAIVNINVPSLEGFAFVGWFDENGVQITDRNGKSLSPWFYDSEVSLRAKYAEKYYIYITDSITGTTTQFGDFYLAGDQVLVYCDAVTGYHFDGFFSDSGRLESVTLEFYQIVPEGDVYLTAKFTPKQFTVILDADGGVCKETQITVSYGEQVVFPTVYKEGYIFKGWRYADQTYDGDATLTSPNGTLQNASGSWDRDSNVTLVPYFVEDTSESTSIADGAGFVAMAANPSGSYKLVTDIDMSGIIYTPFEFTGTLEGNGFTVKNLSLSTDSGSFGIFTRVSGTINNITFENIAIKTTAYGSNFAGGVCGELAGGTLNRIVFKGTVSGQGGDSADIGGLVGKMSSGTISYCESYATVIGNSIENAGTTGGIVGFAPGGSIGGCINYGTVTGAYRVGGIVGDSYIIPTGVLTNAGVVNGQYYVGGIVGLWECHGSISSNLQLTNTAAITGIDHVGGIMGRHVNTRDNYANYVTTLSNFTNSASISGSTYVGGIMGSAYINNYKSDSTVAKVSNLINTGNITGVKSVGGLFGYFHAEGGSYIKGSSSKAIVTAESYVGGLCGEIWYTIFDGCTNIGSTIVATGYVIDGSNYNAYVGGYAGLGYGARNCENSVRIEYAHQARFVGGFFGHSNGAIENCKNTAEVYAPKATYVGGIAGRNDYSGSITFNGLTNTGNITATSHTGGIFGEIYNYCNAYTNYYVNLSRFTNSGKIVSTTYVGGIIGYYYAVNGKSDSINTTAVSFANTGDVTGTRSVGGIIGYSNVDGASSLKNSSSSANITAEFFVGGIMGEGYGLTLDTCSNTGSTITATGHRVDGTSYYAYVGGYVGHGNNVYNCINYSDISYSAKGIYVGGIIGLSNGVIQGCENNGNITSSKAGFVGGIAGYVGSAGSLTHSSLKNTGDISGTNDVGGIFGKLNNIVDSYTNYTVTLNSFTNEGTVTGSGDYVGGIAGTIYLNNYKSDTNKLVATALNNSGDVKGNMFVGGIFGYTFSDTGDSAIELSSSSSKIEAKAYLGGICGKAENVKINNSSNEGTTIVATGYYLSDTVYYAFVGGYAGEGYCFYNCENNSEIVYAERGIRIGGIAGACNGSVELCTNNGSITATRSSQVGGIVGYNYHSGSTLYSKLTNTGAITGSESVGGIIGNIYNRLSQYSNYTVTMSELYNFGEIVGTKFVGGNIGYAYSNNDKGEYTRICANIFENSANVTGTVYVGGCVGYMETDSDASYIIEAKSSGAIKGEYYVGGIAGLLSSVALQDSSNEGSTITATGAMIVDGKYYTYVGGYVGRGWAISDCHNASHITVTQNGANVGGIAGSAYGSITNCSNTGTITAQSCNYVGGIAGLNDGGYSLTFQELTNEADITGADFTAGIFGGVANHVSAYSNYTVTLAQITNTGSIAGSTYVGGIVGHMALNNGKGEYVRLNGSLIVNEGDVTGTSNVGGLMAYCSTDTSSSIIVGYTSTGTVSGELSSQTIYQASNVTLTE